jgi:hypothetical protein
MKTFAESLQTSCWENAKNHPWKLAEIRRNFPTFFPTLTESRMINPVIFYAEGEWLDPESNRGHEDFQSSALPTELSSREG